jgi:hypothetical protein
MRSEAMTLNEKRQEAMRLSEEDQRPGVSYRIFMAGDDGATGIVQSFGDPIADEEFVCRFPNPRWIDAYQAGQQVSL